MNRRRTTLAAVCTLLAVASMASAEVLNFTAQIDEGQVNNCNGSGSEGTGTGIFTLDTDTGLVNYNITFQGLEGTETASHVHGAAPRCVNIGVLYPLPLGSPKVGQTNLNAQQQQDMIDGLHYVNIHSTLHPGGEIRGQIELDSGVPATGTWGLVALAVCVLVGGGILAKRGRASVQIAP